MVFKQELPAWTGEAARLAGILRAVEGATIAEIGGGNGAMAREEGLTQLTVVEAAERATNLPTACCSAVDMRNVLHQVDDWVIDFAPGALPHLADDHGAEPDKVVAAFSAAGLRLERRDDRWGGGTYLLAFRRAP